MPRIPKPNMQFDVQKLFEKYASLDERQKRLIAFSIIGIIIGVFLFLLYMGKANEKKTRQLAQKQEETKEYQSLLPEKKTLERSLYFKIQQRNKELEKQLKEMQLKLRKQQEEMKRQYEEQQKKLLARLEQMKEELKHSEKTQQAKTTLNGTQVPGNVPPPPGNIPYFISETTKQGKKKGQQGQWIGGIGGVVRSTTVSQQNPSQQKAQKKEKKKEITIYLPPSFVQGDMLNGFTAFTSFRGKRDPERVIFRLSDLAVLPNEVKANLKGCFVIGEAYGVLSSGRARVRLLRLSCIARDGSAVIDEKVTGWVVDEDGKSGIDGHVYTKMGAFLAYYTLAGLLEGFGNAYSASLSNISVEGGSMSVLPNPDDALKSAFGKGLGRAGKGLAQFYLDLAEQTLPVIEVGAGKRVTIVFDKGVKLHLRKICLLGGKGCLKGGKTGADSLGSLAFYL